MKRKGNITTALSAVAVIVAAFLLIQGHLGKYSWEKDLRSRIALDFSLSRSDVKEYIQKYIPDVTEEQIDEWTSTGKLESMDLDGKRMYFHSAAPNLFRIDPMCREIKIAKDGDALERHLVVDKENIPEILSSPDPISAPRKMIVTYTLTVHPDAVPAGETIRCWLPFPRRDVARQKGVRFLEAGARVDEMNYFWTEDPSSELIRFSSPDCEHSTLYMEIRAQKGQSAVFTEKFEYTSYGEYHRDLESRVLPYDKTSETYRKYTAEREKHIVFTPLLGHLADSLTDGIDNPYLQARAIFTWIDGTFPWARAREYSTIENIPEYILTSGHGDCGMASLLFVTMCRYKGIPAHFQSGFMMHPGAWNMHDWAEVYFEGVGWVPVDADYGIPPFAKDEYLSLHPESEYFFLGGIDSWRMVVNQDWGKELDPAKRYPRSETVDFQRGEVEWKGGNLYFPAWSWDMKIQYVNK